MINTSDHQWLFHHGGARSGIDNLVGEIGAKLRERGMRLMRVSVSLSDFHPEVIGRSYSWQHSQGTRIEDRQYTPRRSDLYLDSPIRLIHDGADGVRRKLVGPGAQLDFPITRELVELGATDYVGMALRFSDGTRHFVSWASDAPEGFSTEELLLLDEILPLMSLRLEIEHSRLVTEQILKTYLGDDAAQRVILGAVRRHSGEDMDAVIFYCDLRGFTRLTEALSAADVIQVLSAYYDAVSGPVRNRGGDILKMIGDGMLAVFPVRGGLTVERAAGEAIAAAVEARAALAGVPPETLPDGAPKLQAGFALHVGTVTFGNVGSRDRLDFTVIGPAVNEVTRLEAQTKILGRSILMSAAFAHVAARANAPELKSLGFHALRGIRDPREIFTLA